MAALLEKELPGSAGGISVMSPFADDANSASMLQDISEKDRARAEEEQIRMRDCRNMIALVDMVRKGRLQASLAALRAGYFAGEGFLAQLGFMGAGAFVLFGSLTWLVLTEADMVSGGGVVPLFQAGWFCCIPTSASFFSRGWYLRQLELHDGKRGDSVASMNEEERIGRRAQLSLSMSLFWVGVFILWAGSYYISADGDIDLSPVLPAQNHGFVVYVGIALVPLVLILLPMSWLVHLGELKRAQTLLYLFYLVLGFVIFGGCIMVSGPLVSLPRVLLLLFAGGIWTVGAITWLILWDRKRRAMTKELVADMERYEGVWAVLRADPRQREALEELEARVAAYGALRQRQEWRPSAEPSALHTEARKTREQLLIMLTQAWGINDKFQRIAASWKAQCAVAGTGGEEHEKGLLPKRRARAIEKVWRAYGGDATRLRDLVRCSLVFDDAADLSRCLGLVLADPRVRLVQVKNRFAGAYDARAESCGYRDVQLKVTLAEADAGAFTPDELAMGLHEHVCEVQLHLKKIYELKNDAGHKRYVDYRNRMAE